MTRKQEIPVLAEKVLYVGLKQGLGPTLHAIATRIGFPPRTLNEAVNGEPVAGKKGLIKQSRDKLADCLGVGRDWVEFFDFEGLGRDTLEAFKTKYEQDGKPPPCLRPDCRTTASLVPSPPPTNLISQRVAPAWALDAQLCGVTLLGGQYEAADIDFELSGQPTILTVTDEAKKRILLQREIVVSRCTLELDLGGAELHGGLTAMKRAVNEFLNSPEGGHLFVTVTGTATAPRLTIQARDGPIGLFRPLVRASKEQDPIPLCWLSGVLPDAEISARVRLFGSELQDHEVTGASLASTEAGDEAPPAILKPQGSELPVDDRIRLMRRLWEIATAKEQDGFQAEPGSITLAFDMRKYSPRQS